MLVSSQPHTTTYASFSLEVLVKLLHSLVKTKLQVKTQYTSTHGQPHTIRFPRRLIPYYRRTSRIPRPRPNNCSSHLQPSTLPTNYNTHRKVIIKHSRRTRNRTSLDNSTCSRTNYACPTIPTNPVYDRRD